MHSKNKKFNKKELTQRAELRKTSCKRVQVVEGAAQWVTWLMTM